MPSTDERQDGCDRQREHQVVRRIGSRRRHSTHCQGGDQSQMPTSEAVDVSPWNTAVERHG